MTRVANFLYYFKIHSQNININFYIKNKIQLYDIARVIAIPILIILIHSSKIKGFKQ
jgi:hypothetical protein